MYTSSTNSSYSSSNASSDPNLPYQQPQPVSAISLGSQHPRRTPMVPKYPRFYSSPMEEAPDSTPLNLYGLEQRPLSIIEKPKLLRRVSHALDDIKEDLAYQLADSDAAAKLKRRSTLFLDGSFNAPSNAPNSRPGTVNGPPRSRPMSIISMDTWSAPQRGLSRRLSRRLSIFSRGKGDTRPNTASISTPNLIGSSALAN
ncbi:hypothetical protein N7478_001823 [Penicillium angulare]|uniref:uncharacterized protein n=1 Tax=Penicillium angulare TaxID=116970 RepID=UPI0025412668|nr:uncharacterized protein N7478_001823 [Penicillium angulare]KAJ5288793.1 hypothetical protein N7478_001823 [Penicillium angulare]